MLACSAHATSLATPCWQVSWPLDVDLIELAVSCARHFEVCTLHPPTPKARGRL